MDYLQGLNEKQRQAVLHTGGPLLIMAGAGSGKTRVVTHKIAYLIEEKRVFPGNILAITFTNKAANEMKDRVAKLLEINVDSMWMGTFHSICVRILRRDIERIGYSRSFTIYDRDDQVTLIKECIKESNLNKENYKPNSVLAQISKLKDNMTDPDKYINENYSDYYLRSIGELYALYLKKLKKYNALDFDDLLIKTVELLRQEKPILDYYKEKFQYIFVDEYQDTNKVQYDLIKLLTGKNGNICGVGDSDQSIYGWRGADISNILNFEKDFKNSTTILLEQNYRSTSNILNLANRVIKNNKERKPKNLWTENQDGEKIIYEELRDGEDEAIFVSSKIDELLRDGYNPSDIAILYRTNAQSRLFEEAFMRKNIAYKIVGGLKFYDRKEIKDIVAYLKVLENPMDNISLKRIINVPKRGIGNTTVANIEEVATEKGDSIYGALLDLDNAHISGRAKSCLKPFIDMMNMLMAKKEIMTIKEFIEEIIETSGYIRELEKENTIEAQTRIENIKEFISVAIDFEAQIGQYNFEEFLANIALLSDVDKTEDSTEVVTMMTVHSAKGLEFPVVFMVGMEDGLFPISRAMESEEEIEEERRLCYVALTRAEKLLYITSAKIRTIYGNVNYTLPSRFIKEMGDAIENKNHMPSKEKLFQVHDFTKKREPIKEKPRISEFSFKAQPKAKPINNHNKDAKVGDKVKHKKFGQGTIVQTKDRDNDLEIVIAFEDGGLKRLLLSIAPIEIVR